MNDKKGIFVMIEGTDGSGKTTQVRLLVEALQKNGHKVHEISFPQYGKPSAAMVESYLRGDFGSADEVGPYPASALYAMDRFAAKKTIQTWIDEGSIVIANRYVASNMGHQGGKISDPVARQTYFDWIYNLEYTIFEIPKPDVNIILHVPTEISKMLLDERTKQGTHDRIGKDIHEEDIEHLRHAELAYLDIAKRFPEFTLIECSLDGLMRTREDIHQDILAIISTHI